MLRLVSLTLLLSFLGPVSLSNDVISDLVPSCDCGTIAEWSEQVTKILEATDGKNASQKLAISQLSVLAIITKTVDQNGCEQSHILGETPSALEKNLKVIIGQRELPTELIHLLDLKLPGQRDIIFSGKIGNDPAGKYLLSIGPNGQALLYRLDNSTPRWKQESRETVKDGSLVSAENTITTPSGESVKIQGRENGAMLEFKGQTELENLPLKLDNQTSINYSTTDKGEIVELAGKVGISNGPVRLDTRVKQKGEEDTEVGARIEIKPIEQLKIANDITTQNGIFNKNETVVETQAGPIKLTGAIIYDAKSEQSYRLGCSAPVDLAGEKVELTCAVEGTQQAEATISGGVTWEKKITSDVKLKTKIQAKTKEGEVLSTGARVDLTREVAPGQNYGAYIQVDQAAGKEAVASVGVQAKIEIGRQGPASMLRVFKLYKTQVETRGGSQQRIAYYQTWKYVCDLDKKRLKIEEPRKRFFGGVDESTLYQIALPIRKAPVETFQEPADIKLESFCR
jgi:hypothetical protein